MARTEQDEKQAIIYQPVPPLQKDYTVQKEQKAQRHDQEEGPGFDHPADHEQPCRLTQMENWWKEMNADQISKTNRQPETLDPCKRRSDDLRINPRINIQEQQIRHDYQAS
jgi:hypothetical protein